MRACFGACRNNHLLLSLEFRHGELLAEQTTTVFRDAFNRVVGATCSDVQFGLACTHSHKGDLGLVNPSFAQGPAFLSAFFTYAADALPTFPWSELQEAWYALRTRYGLNNCLGDLRPSDVTELVVDKKWQKQEWWQCVVEHVVEQQWHTAAPLRLAKLKELAAARYAGDITSLVSPEDGEPELPSHGWRLCARFRLGLQLDELASRNCGAPSMPLVSTPCAVRSSGFMRAITTAGLCVVAGLKVELEAGPTGAATRPVDVLVFGLGSDSPTAVDFSVVHALQLSATLVDVLPLRLAKETESRKLREISRSVGAAALEVHSVCSRFECSLES